jgi:hypothetical protein
MQPPRKLSLPLRRATQHVDSDDEIVVRDTGDRVDSDDEFIVGGVVDGRLDAHSSSSAPIPRGAKSVSGGGMLDVLLREQLPKVCKCAVVRKDCVCVNKKHCGHALLPGRCCEDLLKRRAALQKRVDAFASYSQFQKQQRVFHELCAMHKETDGNEGKTRKAFSYRYDAPARALSNIQSMHLHAPVPLIGFGAGRFFAFSLPRREHFQTAGPCICMLENPSEGTGHGHSLHFPDPGASTSTHDLTIHIISSLLVAILH